MLPRLGSVLAALCGALWGVAAFAAEPEVKPLGAPLSCSVTKWTSDDGLPQNGISAIQYTKDGFLWLGTWGGLVRFDGTSFVVCDKSNTPELQNDTINALAEDDAGVLWIGTRGGLVRYRDHEFRRYTIADGLPGNDVWRFAASKGGGVWMHSSNSVVRCQNGVFSRPLPLKFAAKFSPLVLSTNPNGELNILTPNDWLVASPGGQVRTNLSLDSPTHGLRDLLVDGTGNAWLDADRGLRRLQNGSLSPIGPDEIAFHPVKLLLIDHHGACWMQCINGKLYRWFQNECQALDLEAGVCHCMTEGPEGVYWVGTDTGLVQLRFPPVRAFTVKDGLPANKVLTVCEGRKNTIWVGTAGGICRFRNGRRLRLGLNGVGCGILSVWPSDSGGVWRASSCRGEVFEFQEAEFKSFTAFRQAEFRPFAPDGVLPSNLNCLYLDHLGRLLVGTGLGVFASALGQLPHKLPETEGVDVRTILEGPSDTLLFGTKGRGIARLQQGAMAFLSVSNGLSNNNVWSIYRDPEGTLWLGTDNGFNRYRDGRLFAFGLQQGLLETRINCVVGDDAGCVWLSGLKGIYRIERTQLNAVAAGRAERVDCFAIGTADGMLSPETNGGENQPAGWKARDGILWFPTMYGLVSVDPRRFPVREKPPVVSIVRLTADNTTIFSDSPSRQWRAANPKGARWQTRSANEVTSLRIAPGHGNVINIDFSVHSFVEPKRDKFRHKLIGLDSDWSPNTGESSVSYLNLKPGKYRFEVMGANYHNTWSSAPATIDFVLEPYFWQTRLFFWACGIGVIGLAATVQSYRLNWQKRALKLEEQRALANERSRIARDIHDDLGSRFLQISVLGELAGRGMDPSTESSSHLSKLRSATGEVFQALDEVVWAANPKQDSLAGLVSYLRQYVPQFLVPAGIHSRLDFPAPVPEVTLRAEVRHEVFLVIKEALQNVVKHAEATEVKLGLEVRESEAAIHLKDNGKGFKVDGNSNGDGLGNMRHRMVAIGGQLSLKSALGEGTEIILRFPL